MLGTFKLPKDSEEQQKARRAAIQIATMNAARVPLHTVSNAVKVMDLAARCAKEGNINAISDAMSGAALAHAAVIAAGYNVRINVNSLEKSAGQNMLDRASGIGAGAGAIDREIRKTMEDRGSDRDVGAPMGVGGVRPRAPWERCLYPFSGADIGFKPDLWIRKMAIEHKMIKPFTDSQVSQGVISYGVSSYGYDVRVADEFKIFTNIFGATVDPKQFDPKSMVDLPGKSASSPRTRSRSPARWSTSASPARC